MAATAVQNDDPAQLSPLLFMTAFPGEGHTNPLITIASHLVKRGYEAVFMAPLVYETQIRESGAEYLPVDNPITESVFRAFREASDRPQGPERMAAQYKAIFLDMQPTRTQSTEDALVMLQARHPGRQIILLEDVFNASFWAFRHGRPLPKGLETLPKSLGIGVSPVLIESQDTGPVSLGLPPDATESGRQRNKALYELADSGPMKLMVDAWREVWSGCGCTGTPEGRVFRSLYVAHEHTLQLCSPSLDYSLSDMPSCVEFVGVLPRKSANLTIQYPPWWSQVQNRHENFRHVVFVSQGTLNPDWSELIIPTINAFSDRPDVLVVATLGARGAELPPGVTVPPNARVIDYFPYDAMLEYADVFVSNAGYGTLTHAVSNGVPVLLAGQNEEKIEVTMRAVHAGVGLSLGTQTPTVEQVRHGVERILAENKYRKAAMKLKMENDDLDALSVIEAKVKELTI